MADGSGGQVDEQLREIELRVDLVPAAGAGQASEDGRSSSAARIAYEEGVFAVQNDALHFAFADIVVDRHGAVRAEDV